MATRSRLLLGAAVAVPCVAFGSLPGDAAPAVPAESLFERQSMLTVEELALDVELRSYMEERRGFNLRSDEGFVRDLLDQLGEPGSNQYLMTDGEREAFERWQRVAPSIEDAVLPTAREIDGFGGAFYDHSKGGVLVVNVDIANLDGAVVQLANAVQDVPSPGYEVRQVNVTFDELKKATHDSWALLERIGYQPLAIAADVVTSSVRLDHLAQDSDIAVEAALWLEEQLGVKVTLAPALKPTDQACTNRDNCWSPMKAGDRIYMSTGGNCTMGFHVERNSNGDALFLTSGHCSPSTGTPSFTHPGLPNPPFGHSFTSRCYATSPKHDMQLVQFDDAQAGQIPYAWNVAITTWAYPTTGAAVSASLGRTDALDPGIINDNYLTYTGENCGAQTVAADHNGIVAQGGDSGSPIRWNEYGEGNRAVGVHSTANGYFARVRDAIEYMDVVVYTP